MKNFVTLLEMTKPTFLDWAVLGTQIFFFDQLKPGVWLNCRLMTMKTTQTNFAYLNDLEKVDPQPQRHLVNGGVSVVN